MLLKANILGCCDILGSAIGDPGLCNAVYRLLVAWHLSYVDLFHPLDLISKLSFFIEIDLFPNHSILGPLNARGYQYY